MLILICNKHNNETIKAEKKITKRTPSQANFSAEFAPYVKINHIEKKIVAAYVKNNEEDLSDLNKNANIAKTILVINDAMETQEYTFLFSEP